MAGVIDTEYIQELKDLLVRLDEEASEAQEKYGAYSSDMRGNNPENAEIYKQQIITIATLWASIGGIYEGLTGDNYTRKKYSINTWTDGSIPGFENAVEIYQKGIETGKELSEFIKDAETIACGGDATVKKTSMGGNKRNIMKGGAPKPAKFAMTLAIITGLTFGVTQTPITTATVTAYSQAKDYLLQLAYGMRIIKTGCMTPAATFWNSLMVSIAPTGALDSCVQIARDNQAALLQLRTTVIASFNGLIAALSSAGLALGRSEFSRMFTYIENNIADPLCDLITNIATSTAALSQRTCRKMTRDVQQGIQSLIEYAKQPTPIAAGGELAEIANAFEATTEEVAASEEPLPQRQRTSDGMDSFLMEIGANPLAMKIIQQLQQKIRNTRAVNSGGRRRGTKKNKKTRKSRNKRQYRKTRQKKRKVSRRKLHTK